MEKNQVRESGQTQESGTSDPTTGIISEGVRPPELHQDIIPPEGFRISEGTEGIAGAGVRSAASAAEAFLTGVQRQLRTGRQTQPVPDRQTQADQQMQPVPDRQTQIDQQMQPVSDRQTRADRQEWTDQPVVEAPDAKQTDQVYQMQPEDQQYQAQTPDTLVSPELENPEVLKYLQETEELTQNPEKLWEVLMKSYPKIQPFDYDEGCDILTIRPQDIGRLPREVWVYGNNSFLLHGYYNFRYLILVRLGNSKGKPRYLLGIPGHYYSNEKYMASMFGFPNFVLSKKQPSNDGRFGYWYTDIRMG